MINMHNGQKSPGITKSNSFTTTTTPNEIKRFPTTRTCFFWISIDPVAKYYGNWKIIRNGICLVFFSLSLAGVVATVQYLWCYTKYFVKCLRGNFSKLLHIFSYVYVYPKLFSNKDCSNNSCVGVKICLACYFKAFGNCVWCLGNFCC